MQIIPFDPKYTKDFAALNVEWLEKYFAVEPHDAELLEQCQETIIDKGGYIFFGQIDDEIVGTFALIKIDSTTYELGKMAVTPKYQGQRLGQQLMEHCMDLAKSQGWKKLVLYSSRRLPNALHIYRKYGFQEVVLEKNSPYQRSDIKMEARLL